MERIVGFTVEIGETEGRTTIRRERIELSERTLTDFRDSTVDSKAVATGVRQLTMIQADIGIDGGQTCTLAVMDDTLLHLQAIMFRIQFGRITDDTIDRITYLRPKKVIVHGGFTDMDAIPLSADTVVGQIIKHIVEPVTTHHTVFCA